MTIVIVLSICIAIAVAVAIKKHVTLAQAKAELKAVENELKAAVATVEDLRKSQTMTAVPSRTVAIETATINKTA